MSQSTYIYFDADKEVDLQKVKDLLAYYKEITTKTGEQLDWSYGHHALPYSFEVQEEDWGNYLLLKGDQDLYHAILIGVNNDSEKPYIQLTLPNNATHGDKGKANEFARFLTKKVEGKLKLFNGRMAQ